MRQDYQCESYDNGVWYNTSGSDLGYSASGFVRPDGKIQVFPSNGGGSTDTNVVEIGVATTQSYSIQFNYM